MSVLLPWIFLILFVAACGLGGWAFWVWWQRPRYTRERFAFSGFLALTGLGYLCFSSLLSEVSVISLVSHILSQPFSTTDIPTSPLSPLEAVLFSVVFSALIYAYLEVFKHWDGQKSIAQHEQEQFRKSPNVLEDIALLLARDPEIRKKLQPYQGNMETASTVLEKPETVAWHQRARQLWILKHRSYQFESEYDPSHGWLGEEKNTGALVLLACFTEAPSKAEIDKLAEYVKQVADHKQISFELILAVKNGTESKQGSLSYPLKYTSEVELLDNLVNFDDYFNDIRYRIERAKLPGSDWTLQDMYTPSHYRFHQEKQPQAEPIEQFIFRWLAENTPRQLAVLGEYGQGKSTLSLLLCYQLINKYKTDATVRIPILIELRGKTLRTLQPEELLAIWAKNYHIDPQALLHLHLAGRLLLIFEGFDEIDLSGDTEARIAHFRTLWRFNHNHAKIIITGRPNFFLDSQELQRALGDTEQSYTLHLEPFDLQQIEKSLREVKPKIRTEIIALAEKDRKFREVAARPSLLYIVALLWEEENLSERVHLNSADVIDLFIKHSLQRQQTKQDDRKFMVLNSAERRYFMMGIAAYMAAKQLPNQISKSQLEETVNLLVDAIPDVVSCQVTEVSRENSRPLRSEQRLEWSTKHREIMESIHTDVRSCGLLVTDLSKDGMFKFAHKSYMELLQALVIYQSLFATMLEQQIGKSISNIFKLQLTDLQGSDESIGFLAELLKSDLNKQGVIEETSVAQGLQQILMNDRFTSSRTIYNYLIEKLVVFSGEINFANLLVIKKMFDLSSTSYLAMTTLLSSIIVSVASVCISFSIYILLEYGVSIDYYSFINFIFNKSVAMVAISALLLLFAIIIIDIIVHNYFLIYTILSASLFLFGGTQLNIHYGIEVNFTLEEIALEEIAVLIFFSTLCFNSFLLGYAWRLAIDIIGTSEFSISKRLHLWYRSCKSLNLSQDSIEKVAGKGMVRLLAEREENNKRI